MKNKKSGFTIKRPRKRSSHGFGPWNCNTRLDKLWGTLTDKLFREPLVLLCFRLKMLKNNWFYYGFAQKCWKTIGFTVFSLKNVEKPMVLLCFRWKILKNHWFYCVFAQKCWKTIGFTVFSLKNVEKPLVLLCFRS